MNMKVKAFILIVTGLLLSENVLFCRLSLQEVRTASDHVLVLFFTSDTVDINEVNTDNITAWKINGEPPGQIFRFATRADECDHHVYLETNKLTEGKSYHIETPYGEVDFVFTERNVFCESIKTNQAAYSALSKSRYANFAIWLGNGGSHSISSDLPDYEVFETAGGKTIYRGTLKESGPDSSSGDFVYRIDLSGVPEGGPYKIAVRGYGSSHPFGIGGEFSKKLAYTMFRAQYMQRCGCPIEQPPVRKKACHNLVYDVDGPIGEANIVVEGTEPAFPCYGGYHDAGDADRRAYHIINPIVNLMIFEAFPNTFYDGQFDIPGKFDSAFSILGYTNNIPDILDEAVWGALVWEYLQNEDGSIHFGTETKGYPEPFTAPMDEDSKKYGTVKTDPRATCTGAGLFLHLARLVRSYEPEHSAALVRRAEKAMQYGKDDMAEPEKLYFYIQQYLLTGDETAHRKVKALYKAADSLKYSLFRTQGYSLNDHHFDNPAYIFSYIAEKEVPTDQVIVTYFKTLLQHAADSIITMLQAHAYPVGNNSAEGGWGHNVRQPQYAVFPLLYWSLTGEQHYFDAASELMDWKLGLNPVGISYVTGLGFHQVHNPHDRESAYTIKQGWGPKPGITVFGPGVISRRYKYPVFPEVIDLPKERQFVDEIRAINFTEFTIFETMTHDALYTVLAGGGKWDGKDPYQD